MNRYSGPIGTLIVALSFPLIAVGERWPDERTAGPFVFHADFALTSYENLVYEMRYLQSDLIQLLNVRPAQEEVHVYLFQHKPTYQRYVRHYFPTVPNRRALYIKARGPGMLFAYQSNELAVDVRHEGTHALLHAALPYVPLWLDEGLAEYFEVQRDQRASASDHLTATRWAARFGHAPSLEKLDALEELSEMGASEYRHAWAWTHFMLHGSAAAREELIRFLADIQANAPSDKLSRRLRRRIPNLDALFLAHFQRWN